MRLSLPTLATFLLTSLVVSGCQTETDKSLVTASTEAPASQTVQPESAEAIEGTRDEVAAGSGDNETVAVNVADPQGKADGDGYVPPEPGTILTFRNNWNSLPPMITYRVDGIVNVADEEYLKMTAISGMGEKVTAYYKAGNFALKGYRDAGNKPMLSYNPVEERYRFPMKPGDKWVSAWRSYDHRQEKQFKGGGVVQVVSNETIKLPAGEFETVKVRLPVAREMPSGMTHFVWFAPELGVTVKEQIGNGTMNWTQILEKVVLPADKAS